MRLLPTAVGAALWVAIASPGFADEARDGRALFEQARFDEALAWFEAVLADPAATVATITTAHLYVAALRLVEGDEAAARDHAAAAVALDGDVRSPPGAPRRLDDILGEARAGRPEGGLDVRVEAPSCGAPGSSVSVRATASGTPPGLVRIVRLRCSGGERAVAAESEAAAQVEISVPDASVAVPLSCVASALSGAGVELRATSREIPLCRVETLPSPRDVAAAHARGQRSRRAAPAGATERPSGQGRGWLWVGVGAGAAVVVAAVVVGVLIGTADRDVTLGPIRVEDP